MQFGKPQQPQQQPAQFSTLGGSYQPAQLQAPPQQQPAWGVPAHQLPPQQGWGSPPQQPQATAQEQWSQQQLAQHQAPVAYQQPAYQQPQQAIDPMALFKQGAQQQAAPQFQGGHAHAAPSTQPQYKVTLSTELATQDAMFHTVIRQAGPGGQGGILILGVEANYPNKTVPKVSAEPLAIYVHGASSVFKVESMGVQYDHKGETLSHFMIVEERPI